MVDSTELQGLRIAGGAPDKCWLPGDWSNTVDRPFSEDELLLWRTRCAHRRLEYRREFTRDRRPEFLVQMEAL